MQTPFNIVLNSIQSSLNVHDIYLKQYVWSNSLVFSEKGQQQCPYCLQWLQLTGVLFVVDSPWSL